MTNKINGIDVSEYFIEVVDEGGSTIDYKILPNSERLLVEKIFEQNQQLARLQEKNEELKDRNANLRLNLATYDLPEIKKVLTDWRTGKLDKKFKNLQKENEELKKEKEKIEEDAEYFLNGDYCDEKCNSAKNELKYKQALENIRTYINQECENKQCPQTCANCFIGNVLIKANEVLNDRD